MNLKIATHFCNNAFLMTPFEGQLAMWQVTFESADII
jgi:hypothetical protein